MNLFHRLQNVSFFEILCRDITFLTRIKILNDSSESEIFLDGEAHSKEVEEGTEGLELVVYLDRDILS